jgi:hypothetical protein
MPKELARKCNCWSRRQNEGRTIPAWRKVVPTPPSGWPVQERLEDHLHLESPFQLCAFHLTVERSGRALAPLQLSCPNEERDR